MRNFRIAALTLALVALGTVVEAACTTYFINGRVCQICCTGTVCTVIGC